MLAVCLLQKVQTNQSSNSYCPISIKRKLSEIIQISAENLQFLFLVNNNRIEIFFLAFINSSARKRFSTCHSFTSVYSLVK